LLLLLLLGSSCYCHRSCLQLLQLKVLLEQLHLLLLREPLPTCCHCSSSDLLCLSCLLLGHSSCSLDVCCCLPQLLERRLVLQGLHCQVHSGGEEGLCVLKVPVGSVNGGLGLGAHLIRHTTAVPCGVM
jgi:hypothetical protein